MTKLNIDTFIAATEMIYLRQGDVVKKSAFVCLLIEYGIDPTVAKKVWAMMNKAGRIKNSVVVRELEEFMGSEKVDIVRTVLLQLKPDGGLTKPLVDAVARVTGIYASSVQAALNSLESEYFLEQRKCVQPFQYIPRKWSV